MSRELGATEIVRVIGDYEIGYVHPYKEIRGLLIKDQYEVLAGDFWVVKYKYNDARDGQTFSSLSEAIAYVEDVIDFLENYED